MFAVDKAQADSTLVGAIVYTRHDDILAVIFLAVHPDYAYDGIAPEKALFHQLLAEVLGVAAPREGNQRDQAVPCRPAAGYPDVKTKCHGAQAFLPISVAFRASERALLSLARKATNREVVPWPILGHPR